MASQITTTTTTTTEASAPKVLHLQQQGLIRKIKPVTAGDRNFTEIPTLDISLMYSDSLADRKELAAKVRDAASRVGFMQIKNHGVDQEIIDDAFAEAKSFFELPKEEKEKVHQSQNKDFQGYEPLYYTNVGMLKRGGK
jgi:hypothetical protein